MSPKKLIIALWGVVALVALAIVLAPSNDDYREFASTQVTPVEKAAPSVSPSSTAVVAVAEAKPAPATASPAVSLGGVSRLMADAASVAPRAASPAGQMAAVAQPASPATVAKDAGQPDVTGSWRRASTVSKVEIEAAIKRDAMTPETAVAFRSACGHDHDLHFDAAGKPLYACSMELQVGPDTTGVTSTPSYPLADTFLLHSRPTATRKIYLDFDGHVTTGTAWNGGRAATLTTPAFSRDADPAFNDAEKAIVQEAFRRIAEHFAAWDVDVTTEDPGVDGLRKVGAADDAYGIRVVIGPKAFTTSAAGIAYLNSFSDNIDTPCFTFAESSWSAALIAGVTSHEVGHTVSLLHQGQNPGDGEYFGGHGSGALSWSPIMGNGLRAVNQWAKGEYQNASSTQDNLAAIANASSGVPLLADDHGNTPAAATATSGTSVSVGGIISGPADVDVIKVHAGRGDLTITPKVALVAPNLRLQIKVLDSAGTVLGTYEGAGTSGNMAPAPITLNLPAEGYYFIQLDGIGNGTGVTEGYTDYGSIGYYSFDATWAELGNRTPVADATLSATTSYDYQNQPTAMVNFNGTLSTDPDGILVRYIWNFKDTYPAGAEGATTTHRYKAPGTYYPTLTVVDDLGASASTTVTVVVGGPNRNATCSLALVTGSFVRLNSIHDAANATVRVQDQYGNPVRRALVYVSTSGLVSMKRTAIRTNDFGQVNISTPGFRRGARGSVVFTVSTVESPGRPFVNTPVAPVTVAAPSVTLTR
jgi:hypothetical protein